MPATRSRCKISFCVCLLYTRACIQYMQWCKFTDTSLSRRLAGFLTCLKSQTPSRGSRKKTCFARPTGGLCYAGTTLGSYKKLLFPASSYIRIWIVLTLLAHWPVVGVNFQEKTGQRYVMATFAARTHGHVESSSHRWQSRREQKCLESHWERQADSVRRHQGTSMPTALWKNCMVRHRGGCMFVQQPTKTLYILSKYLNYCCQKTWV